MNQKNVTLLLIIIIIALTGTTMYFAMTKNAVSPAANPVAVQNPTTDKSTVPTDWKTYQDQNYGYQFQYPQDWNLASDNNSNPDLYNVTIWKGNGFDENSFHVGSVMYGTNADGSVSSRESYLKMLTSSDAIKMTIVGGEGYYSVNETQGGPSPSIYLVGNKDIFLMSFSIFDLEKTPLAEAEKLFKQIIRTFKFTNKISSSEKTDWKLLSGDPKENCSQVTYKGEVQVRGWYVYDYNYVEKQWMFRILTEDAKKIPVLDYTGKEAYDKWLVSNPRFVLSGATPELEKELKAATEKNPKTITVKGFKIYCEGSPRLSLNEF